MQRVWLLASAINGFLAVALGAFGAHGMQSRLAGLSDGTKRLGWWETAAHYHIVHALALGLVALCSRQLPETWARAAGASFTLGIVLFSGSLYLMSASGRASLGIITPFGGLALLVGWAALAVGAWRLWS